jgi:hypothetical protein
MRPLVHATALFAPFGALTSLASFAFGSTDAGVEASRALFVLAPLGALVAVFLAGRRPGALVFAHFASLLCLSLAICAMATRGASPFGSPSLVIGWVASAAAVATTSASAQR